MGFTLAVNEAKATGCTPTPVHAYTHTHTHTYTHTHTKTHMHTIHKYTQYTHTRM